jgi:hypothetical protein
VTFDLHGQALEVSHDGRPFDEDDVKAISDVLKGTKRGVAGTIGKFGIGFKSVYAFTATPEIHSGTEHFRIKRYIRPEKARRRPRKRGQATTFVFPFDHPELSPEDAFDLIRDGLRRLEIRTLLFLSNLTRIRWSVDAVGMGSQTCQTEDLGDCRRVTVRASEGGKKSQEDWLVFRDSGKPASYDRGTLPVQIAYRLQRRRTPQTDRIVPSPNSRLSVFFPTDRRTDMGFLIQGSGGDGQEDAWAMARGSDT